MGRDKARLEIDGIPLALRIASTLSLLCGSVTLVGDPSTYAALGIPVIPDALPGAGPLSGIEAALRHTSAELNLITACDMPALRAPLLEALFTALETSPAACAVPRHASGDIEPLCAVYRQRCHAPLLQALHSGVHKVKHALQTLELTYVSVADSDSFANLNTPEELRNFTHG